MCACVHVWVFASFSFSLLPASAAARRRLVSLHASRWLHSCSASIIPPSSSPVNPLVAKPPLSVHSSFSNRSIVVTLSPSSSYSGLLLLCVYFQSSTPPPSPALASILSLLALLLFVLYPCQTDKKKEKKREPIYAKGPEGHRERLQCFIFQRRRVGRRG